MSAAAPSSLNVKRFADARAPELRSLLAAVGDDASNRPPRRSRSHNRHKALFWKKPGEKGVSSGQNKKRRREDAPLSRRVRRKIAFQELGQGKNTQDPVKGDVRLCTHVWHAKRFQMCTMWGYHVAKSLFGKGHAARSVINWALQGAVLHDASYHNPIQLEGTPLSISKVLGLVIEPILGSNFAGGYLNAMVHCCGKVPFSPVAPVKVVFQPGKPSTERRKVWLWAHAASFTEALNSLQTACNDNEVVCQTMHDFAMLEVLGVESSNILRKVLKPRRSGASLFQELPANGVFPLEVHDPRDIFLLEETSSEKIKLNAAAADEHPAFAADELRNLPELALAIMDHSSKRSESSVLLESPEVVQSPLTEQSMNKKFEKHRMSHFRLSEQQESKPRTCHVVLLRHESEKLTGWSIVLPRKWVHPFWMKLVLAGARVVGQAERRWLMTYAGKASYPYDFPDCKAYHDLAALGLKEQSEIQSKRPPDKRLPCPSSPPWIAALGVVPHSISVARSSGVFSQVLKGEKDLGSETQWFVRVVVKPDRRGVVEEGSILYAPTPEDFNSWINRVNIEHEEAVREAIGFTTSGQPWRRQNDPACAVCDVGRICEVRAWEVADGRWKQQRSNTNSLFVLFRNPRSSKLRTALATIVLESSAHDITL